MTADLNRTAWLLALLAGMLLAILLGLGGPGPPDPRPLDLDGPVSPRPDAREKETVPPAGVREAPLRNLPSYTPAPRPVLVGAVEPAAR